MLLSIVIPVYNTSKYLRRCLDSIIESQIDNSEVIIINDGSTDDSEDIIKEYLEKHPDIKYISKENEGLGATKNLGLSISQGKYISFIDSDDSIDKNFYKESLKYMEDNYDIIVYDFMSISKDEKFITHAKEPSLKSYSLKEALLYTTIMPSSCNKIVKKELYEKNNLSFPKGLKYEDFATTPILFLSADKIKYIDKPYYNYYLNDDSIMHKKTNVVNYDMSEIIKILEKRLSKFDNYDEEKFIFYNYIWRIESFLLNPIYSISLKERFKYSYKLYKNNHRVFKKINNNDLVKKALDNFSDEEKMFILKRNRLLASYNILGFNYFLFKNARETKIFSIDNKYYD